MPALMHARSSVCGSPLRGAAGRKLVSAAALAAGLAAIVAACGPQSGELNNFEDGGEEQPAAVPDLPGEVCDPRTGDPCAEGEKCSFAGLPPDEGLACVPVLGAGQAGEPCQRIGDSDDCDARHLCWAIDEASGEGVCVGFCGPLSQCQSAVELCTVSEGGRLPLCLLACDPLEPTCLPAWGCYPDSDGRWTCDRARPAGAGEHGSPCDCVNCCAPGTTCIDASRVAGPDCAEAFEDGGDETLPPGCCAELCRAEDGEIVEGVCPTPAERCRPFYPSDEIVAGFEEVGVCRL